MLSNAPPTPVRIDPHGIYTVPALVLLLDLTSATLTRAVRCGELPAVRRGNRVYITGRALLTWLTPDAVAKGNQP